MLGFCWHNLILRNLEDILHSFIFQQRVELNLDLSHWCSVKENIWNTGYKPVNQGEATHDWEFRIKDSKEGDMRQYIEKIVIKLHETFAEPVKGKCVPKFFLI